MRIRWSGKLRGRPGQFGTGAYLWPSGAAMAAIGNIRVTQLPRESPEIGPTLIRLTQLPRESLDVFDGTAIRVTQLPLETTEFATPVVQIRVTQLAVEVVYPFRCGDTPPVPPPPPHTIPIRRLRRAPVLSDREFWQFFEWIELDLQTGILPPGVTEAKIMLRWSDDGGHTWTEGTAIDVGPQAAYAKRALWRRLGRARDRVFEVSMSDPILWAIVAARLGVSEGQS